MQHQSQYSQKSDPSTVEELLDTEEFIASVRKHFGLTRETRTVCTHCGNQLVVKKEQCMTCGNPADGTQQKIWVEKENALMNKKGVEAFITTLRTHVDRNQIASNFSKREIRSIMEDFHKKVAYELAREWDEYGIKNKPQAHKIVLNGSNVVWSLFKRSQDGDSMDIIGGISKDVSKTVRGENNDNNRGIGL